jgi:hypothetical protein
MTTTAEPTIHARERIAVAAGAAILAAGLILVAFVLPAEYAVDPLGTGARLGLLKLGQTGQQVQALEAEAAKGASGQTAIIVPQDREFQEETVEFVVKPHDGMEYKYRLEKGEVLLYGWTATSPVSFELHAEPDGAPKGYAQSYEKAGGTDHASGTLTAPFSGIHGWYWENPGNADVTVKLRAAGYFKMSHEFHKDAAVKTRTFP